MSTFQFIVVPLALMLAMFQIAKLLRGGRRICFLKAVVWLSFALAIYQPDFVQKLATFADIGRGADLLLYGLTVFVMLMTFHFLNQLELQRRQLTLLVREIAISRPIDPDSAEKEGT